MELEDKVISLENDLAIIKTTMDDLLLLIVLTCNGACHDS